MITCQIFNHTEKYIQGVCLDENCKANRPICFRCIEELHQNHKDRKDFQDLGEWLNLQKGQYVEIKNVLTRFQQQINELFNKMNKAVDDCCPPTQLDELTHLTYTRLDQKIKNIIALNKLKPIILDTFVDDEIQKVTNFIRTLSIRVSQILNKEEKKSDNSLLISSTSNLQIFTNLNNQQQKEFYFEQGIELLMEKQSKEAIVEFDKAISVDNGYILAQKWKAYALLQIGQDAQAAQICKQVFQTDRQQIRAYLICGIKIPMIVGQALFNLKEFPQAQHSLKKALQISPDNKKALALQGKTLFRMNLLEESIGCYESSLKIDDKFVFALEGISIAHCLILVYSLIYSRKIEDAKIYYQKLQKVDPYNKQLIIFAHDLEKSY